MSVLPGAEPFRHQGGPIGVLLCHGFTGSPQSLRPWADHLVAAGYSVNLPLLPGHGTTWQDMNRTQWADWYDCLEVALGQLRSSCERVFVMGLSMGAALSLRLAQKHGADVAGLVLVNPAVKLTDPRLLVLPALKHVIGSLPGIGSDIKKPGVAELAYPRTPLRALHSMIQGYEQVVAELPSVSQPVLLLRAPQDHVVPPSSSALVLSRITSSDVAEVLCPDSYHVATLDNDAPMIFESSVAFVRRLTQVPATEGTEGSP